MRDRTSDSPDVPTDVVRARRLELVDEDGKVRAVLGNLARDASTDYWPGLTLRNVSGRDRAWLMVHNLGTELAFDMGGNTVAVLEVLDPGTETSTPRVNLTLCDADGMPVFEFHISIDGDVELRGQLP